jgi:hypothetical protein
MPTHPNAVTFYGLVTKFGGSKVHKVAGTSKMKHVYKNQKWQVAKNITGAGYADVMSLTLLKEGHRLFNQHGTCHWVFMQDNDPCHKKAGPEAIRAWNEAHPGNTVTLLPNWPPNSPDLKPI